MNAQLVVVHADGSSEIVDLINGEHTVGRGSGANISLRSDFASKRHAVLNWNGPKLNVADLGSRNGTSVNGRRIGREWVPLNTGDRLTFGLTEAQVFSALEPDPITPSTYGSNPPGPTTAPATGVSGNMVSASGGAIAAGRDVIYTQTVRESEVGFLAGVFATPSAGRKMMWWGVALSVIGFALSLGIMVWWQIGIPRHRCNPCRRSADRGHRFDDPQ